MSKFSRLLGFLLAVTVLLNGCSMIAVDKEMDDKEIVAEYTGGTVTKAEAMEEYQQAITMYESYGYDITSDPATIKEIQQTILDYLVEDRVVRAKADEMGLTQLTDEERQALIDQATEEYESMLEYYKIYFTGDTDEETDKATKDYLESNGYTLESAQTFMLDSAWQDKLLAEVTKDVEVTDEQVQTAYDDLVSADQESYSADAYSFEYAMATGSTSAWYPEGYRTVKHILIGYTPEQVEALDTLRYELDEIEYEIEWRAEEAASDEEEDDTTDAFAEEEGDFAEDDLPEGEVFDETEPDATDEVRIETDGATDDEPVHDETDGHVHDDVLEEPADTPDEPEIESIDVEQEELGASSMTDAELAARKTELDAEIAALQSEYALALKPRVDEVLAKIAAGEDFDALVEEYGEDDGMKEEPVKTTGYYIAANSEMFDAKFTEAAMALAKVGDISEPIPASAGIHIILYASDVTPGPVPLDQVIDSVRETALDTARSERYDELVAEWVAAANVKTYVDRMG